MTEKSLNQRVAEALGWTEIDIGEFDARGELVVDGYDRVLYRALYGTSPEGVYNLTIPDYENSIDASWEANTDPEATLSLKREGDQTKAFVNYYSAEEPFAALDKSAARAVALATLKWALWLKKMEKEEREK